MEFSNGINAPKESYGKGRKMISVMDILADEPIIYENIRNSVQVDDKTESKNKVENGDLVFVRSSEIPNEVGWAKAYRQEEYALYSGFSIRGKKKSDFDAKFIELSLNNSNREQIERQAGGSTRFNVSQSILKSIEILEPSIEEQIEIGNFFERLDDTIALHQQELTILKQTKQGFLQKMFPKEGESVPEVRFPGFTGDWEEHKLGEISDVTKLAGFEFTKYVIYKDEGEIIALRGLNVKNRKLVLDDVKYIDQSDFSKLNRSKLFKNDILFTYVGTVGELAVVPENDKYYLAPNVARIRLNDNVNPQFVSQMMGNKMFYDKVIFPLIATSSQPALSMENIRKFTLKLPSIEEQTEIGQFFFELDSLITLHQKELELLQETKKAFLQKMFV
ncbi:restriction endonuclease subunit S [Bacillus thuringiensis]|uniref:restriction endonuclease subunit S n=1 Tax=Bacillus thuringiensis TaxID=1428 RepID=UPI000BFBB5E4|nr:methyltransferase type 11 [Bacillus thuringiensis]